VRSVFSLLDAVFDARVADESISWIAVSVGIPTGFGEILGEMGCFDVCTGVQVVDLMVAGGGFEPPTFGL
jgi:hypothetical protein